MQDWGGGVPKPGRVLSGCLRRGTLDVDILVSRHGLALWPHGSWYTDMDQQVADARWQPSSWEDLLP